MAETVTATGADAVRVLPTALAYHFTLPHTIDFLPEVTESLGMKVTLKDTGRNAFEHFTDFVKGDLKYVHIENDEQRRMNDWLTAWITLSTAWPYIPILGLVRSYKLGAEQAEKMKFDETLGGIASLVLTAPFNVVIGLYEAANFTSARIREQGLDLAVLEAFSKLPQVLGAGLTQEEKAHPKDILTDGATKTVANFLLAPLLPLLGTYEVSKTIGDATHKNRQTQFAAMLLGAPVLATLGLPYFALKQSTAVARNMVDQSGLSSWVGKFFNDTSKAFNALGKN